MIHVTRSIKELNDMKSIDDLKKSIKAGVATIEDFLTLGGLYFDIGCFDKIIKLYNKALKLKLNKLDKGRIFYELAEALQLLNRFEDSTANFHKAIDAVHENTSWEALYIHGYSYYNLFLSCMDINKVNIFMEKACDCFFQLIDSYSENSDISHVYYALADIYSKQNEYDMALHYYNLALNNVKEDSLKIQILSSIASVYGEKQQKTLCENYFTEALKIATQCNSSKVYYDIGVACFNAGLLEEANRIFKIALEKKSKDQFLKKNQEYYIDILWHLGMIAYELGINDNDVIHYLKTLLTLIDANHIYYSNINLTLGHFYASIYKNNKAREYYNTVLMARNTSEEELTMAKKCLADIPYDA